MNKNIGEAMESDDLPRIYFNEFGVGMSKNDVLILLGRNGKKEAILNASHITAKSLAKVLNEAISEFEIKTKQNILISDEIEELMEGETDADIT